MIWGAYLSTQRLITTIPRNRCNEFLEYNGHDILRGHARVLTWIVRDKCRLVKYQRAEMVMKMRTLQYLL